LADAGARLETIGVDLQMNFPVLQAAPQPLDEDVNNYRSRTQPYSTRSDMGK